MVKLGACSDDRFARIVDFDMQVGHQINYEVPLRISFVFRQRVELICGEKVLELLYFISVSRVNYFVSEFWR